jgi:hypothetical protein
MMSLRRRSRTDRVVDEVRKTPAVVLIGAGAALSAGLVGLGYLARRRLWQGVALVADAVEEVADTVEDAAEDLADAARERASSGAKPDES